MLLPELRRGGKASAGSAKAFPLAASAKTCALGVSTQPLSPSGLPELRVVRQRPAMTRDARSSMLLLCELSQCSTLCTLYVVICEAHKRWVSEGLYCISGPYLSDGLLFYTL